MNEYQIRNFWQNHSCGESLIGGLEKYNNDYDEFFRDYDSYRYDKESYILECLDSIDFQGKKTLEIGLGQGADAEQLIRRGANFFGMDLTLESVTRTQIRLNRRKLKIGGITQGSAVATPFTDKSFDIVFSYGVLHHIPEIQKAQAEIHRILKPDGELIVMLYAKNSLYYRASVTFFRRLALLGLYLTKRKATGNIAQHLENAREIGIFKYLKIENFIHRDTDGALNPYSKVYDLKMVEKDFPDFKIEKSYQNFRYAPPLPVNKLPFEKFLGWHLWVHLKPR